MLPGNRLWAFTRRGQPFCFKLASLQRQECGLACRLAQKEDSLSALSLHLCRGRNASRDSPLGLHRRRTAFLLQGCFYADAGMLPGNSLWAYTRRGQPFCFKLPSLQRQKCFSVLGTGLTQEEDSLFASSLLRCRGMIASRDSPLGLHRKRTAFLLLACFSVKAGMLPGTRI
jgi:hypothetical protein